VDALEKEWWDTSLFNLEEWYDPLRGDPPFMASKVLRRMVEDAGISFEGVFYYSVGERLLRFISEGYEVGQLLGLELLGRRLISGESEVVKDSRGPAFFRNEKFIEELKFHLRLLRENIESALESAFLKADIEKIEKYVCCYSFFWVAL